MTQKPESESVLSRWSRRKLDTKANIDSKEVAAESVPLPPTEQVLEEDTPVPIWQQPDVDPDIKKSALSALFRQPEFNELDRMNEYDEDFTQFKGLGNIVTQEMKRMLKLAEQKTRPEEQVAQINLDVKEQDSGLDESDLNESHNDDEDNKIA